MKSRIKNSQSLAKGKDLQTEVVAEREKALKHVSKVSKNGIIGRDFHHRD
jgi:hypothetical protein